METVSGTARAHAPILVVGGAGYIGSHMVKLLARRGHRVVTLDNLSTGHRDAVPAGELIEGDMGDPDLLDAVFREHPIEEVLHFAAFSRVDESFERPEAYEENNAVKTGWLLASVVRHGVRRIVYSSSAAVYGEPERLPIDEDHPRRPVSPYGESKRRVEEMLAEYERAYGLGWVSFRYFNAAGADPEGRLGERHEPETHLLPKALMAASGRGGPLPVHGRDHPTEDGTCVRDFVHVEDLCEAHLLGLEHLRAGSGDGCFNLGSGAGHSVQEVVDSVRRVTGRDVPVREGRRRRGDPARLVADAGRARRVLGWKPRYGLDSMIDHAWAWERRLAGLGPPEPGNQGS